MVPTCSVGSILHVVACHQENLYNAVCPGPGPNWEKQNINLLTGQDPMNFVRYLLNHERPMVYFAVFTNLSTVEDEVMEAKAEFHFSNIIFHLSYHYKFIN